MDEAQMLMMADLSRQFVEVNRSPTNLFIGDSSQSYRSIAPGTYGDVPYIPRGAGDNAWSAQSYALNTMQQGFAGTNNPFGRRELYNAGASDVL